MGCLSASQIPVIEGQDDFAGESYHTGRWPHEGVDVSGKRVAVIGTGSTAIQAIPELAKQAAHVTVFQRTPNYSVPARNRPLADDEVRAVKSRYREIREASRLAPSGADLPPPERSANDFPVEERHAELQKRGTRAGPHS